VTSSLASEVFGSARMIAAAIGPPLIMGIIPAGDHFATMIANDRGLLVPATLDDA
jgi:hypothetical protein